MYGNNRCPALVAVNISLWLAMMSSGDLEAQLTALDPYTSAQTIETFGLFT
jgi:hypothetical protein